MLKINKESAKEYFKLTPTRVAVLGLLLALMITLKYAFGFVPGIEVISFLFIMIGIFLPLVDLLLLLAAFNALIVVIYGFGTWWFMYWIIWPIDVLGSKLISKQVKNRFVFGLWGFIAGASVGFWYYWSDLALFGSTYARLNIITAIPVNAIEGFITMILIITIGPMVAKVFKQYSHKFWNTKDAFEFKPVKNWKMNMVTTIFIAICSLVGIVTLYITNDLFFDWKNRE